MSAPKTRILVVQLADLGDLILAAPAIEGLRSGGESRHVTLLTKPGNVEIARKIADEVIVADKQLLDQPRQFLSPANVVTAVRLIQGLRRARFDEILLLHHLSTRFGAMKWAALALAIGASRRTGLNNGRGWFLNGKVQDRGFGAANETDYWIHLVGDSDTVELFSTADADQSLLRRRGVSKRYVVIHPGSGLYSTARRWPETHFAELAKGLVRHADTDIVVVGSEGESEIAQSIVTNLHGRGLNLCGETPEVANLASVVSGALAFVGNDTGVAQVAAKLDVPRIVIFGPTSPATWFVTGPRARALRLDIACSPCLYRDFELGSRSGCATRECLSQLMPHAVLDATLRLIERFP